MIDFHQHIDDHQKQGNDLLNNEYLNNLSKLLYNQANFAENLGLERANIIFNNSNYLTSEKVEEEIDKFLTGSKNKNKIFFTFMVDPSCHLSSQRIVELKEKFDQFLGIKFHSAFQKIDNSQLDIIAEIAQIASEKKMFVMVDGSYGASNIYQYDNLKLLTFLCNKINTPVIFAHGGSLKVKEAMLVALENPHLYFDSSFTISYWKGSSIEQDFAFAIKKLGFDRFFFGSDYPLAEPQEEYRLQNDFLNKHGFSEKEKGMFFGLSAKKILLILENNKH